MNLDGHATIDQSLANDSSNSTIQTVMKSTHTIQIVLKSTHTTKILLAMIQQRRYERSYESGML